MGVIVKYYDKNYNFLYSTSNTACFAGVANDIYRLWPNNYSPKQEKVKKVKFLEYTFYVAPQLKKEYFLPFLAELRKCFFFKHSIPETLEEIGENTYRVSFDITEKSWPWVILTCSSLRAVEEYPLHVNSAMKMVLEHGYEFWPTMVLAFFKTGGHNEYHHLWDWKNLPKIQSKKLYKKLPIIPMKKDKAGNTINKMAQYIFPTPPEETKSQYYFHKYEKMPLYTPTELTQAVCDSFRIPKRVVPKPKIKKEKVKSVKI